MCILLAKIEQADKVTTPNTKGKLKDHATALLLLLPTTSGGLGGFSANLTHKFEESVLHIDAGLGRSFEKGNTKALCKLSALYNSYLSATIKIALVSGNDNRYFVGVLYSEDLLVEKLHFFERRLRYDRVHDKEALASPHVLVTHGGVFLLTGSIQDVKKAGLVVNCDLLPVRVLNGRIILLDEVVLDELDGKGGLTDTTSTDNDKLVFSHSDHFFPFNQK
mmetsp:Transcript_49387/g.127316  ORF Transcript_49387/g.127316 Transcript_49387/m.127316 type:complete len:221 (-) Transcript_49387:381-1043(-)|eukprot:CAMPEP_0113874616 /NCGR_PEP_ID=MMETSP0780_2-20120614/4437_1 /TAXON_ID=652834 /ORGANISM="Palpitomonas bilix" /LENGTH=220 /DNA_ID=CAMNT_0000860417 /DNA_START=138 /DNA_END=800 /DNA_ORIENTATION=+ /assembly_acc=CAM_ASM_000599